MTAEYSILLLWFLQTLCLKRSVSEWIHFMFALGGVGVFSVRSTFPFLMNVWNWENGRKDMAWKRTFKKKTPKLLFLWSSSPKLESKDWLHSNTDINWFRSFFQSAHSRQKKQTKTKQLHVQRADLREVSGMLLSDFSRACWNFSLNFFS